MGLIFMVVQWSRRSVIRGPFLVQSPSLSWPLCIGYGSGLSCEGAVGVKGVVESVQWIFWPYELSEFSSSFKSGCVVDAKALMSRTHETLPFITTVWLRNSGTCFQSLQVDQTISSWPSTSLHADLLGSDHALVENGHPFDTRKSKNKIVIT